MKNKYFYKIGIIIFLGIMVLNVRCKKDDILKKTNVDTLITAVTPMDTIIKFEVSGKTREELELPDIVGDTTVERSFFLNEKYKYSTPWDYINLYDNEYKTHSNPLILFFKAFSKDTLFIIANIDTWYAQNNLKDTLNFKLYLTTNISKTFNLENAKWKLLKSNTIAINQNNVNNFTYLKIDTINKGNWNQIINKSVIKIKGIIFMNDKLSF